MITRLLPVVEISQDIETSFRNALIDQMTEFHYSDFYLSSCGNRNEGHLCESAMVTIKVVEHALKGALVSGASVTVLQIVLARELQRPGSLALSLATFVGLFRLLEDIEKRETGDDSKAPYAGALAAAAALAVLDPRRRGFILSLATSEAIVSVAQRVPAIRRVNNIELFVGFVVYTQLIYTWIYRPDLYSPAQLGALDRFCLQPISVMKDMRIRFPSGAMASRCDVWHPQEASCVHHHVKSFIHGTPKLMKLYLPIFVVTTFLLKWKRWVKGPRPSLIDTGIHFLRTSVALKMSSQLGVIASCIFPGSNAEVATYFSGIFTAFCIFFENEKRRAGAVKTVAIYVLCTSGTWLGNRLRLTQDARHSWQFVLIAAAFGAIFSHPQSQNAQLMRLLYGRSFQKRSGQTTLGQSSSSRSKAGGNPPSV